MDKTNNSLLHKILVVMLSVSLILGNMTLGGFADYAYAGDEESSTVESWDGESIETPQQDDDGYYLIGTAAELAGFASLVNDDYIPDAKGKLTADIDLGSCEWTPIATGESEDYSYCGTFDGQGHTVSGLSISEGNYNKVGLFGMAKDASIKAITVKGEIQAGDCAGGILGEGYNVNISECQSQVNISGISSYAGGIIGYGNGELAECVNAGTLECEYLVGGIAGGMDNASGAATVSVSDCRNEEAVISECYAGGIMGESYGGEISQCKNEGAITGSDFAGGIIGNSGDVKISYSYNAGDVYASYGTAAGIIGCLENSPSVTLESVYSSASVEGSGAKFDGVSVTGTIASDADDMAEICTEVSSGVNVFGYTVYAYEEGVEGYQALNDWYDDESGDAKTMQDLTAALNNGGTAFTYKEGSWPVLTWEAQSGAVSPEELAAAVSTAKTAIEAALKETSEYDAICGQKATELVAKAETSLGTATTLKEVEKIKTETVTALNDIPTSAYKETKKSSLDKYLEGNYNAEEWKVIADSKTELEKAVTESVSKAEIDAKVTAATATAADVITKSDKDKALSDLEAAYAAYEQEDYSEANWEKLTQIYNKAKTDIESSHSKTAILGKSGIGGSVGLLTTAKNAMKAVENKLVALRNEKTAEFTKYFNENYKQSDYSEEKWKLISNPKSNTANKGYYDNALKNIKSATTEAAINEIISTAKANMEAVYTLVEEAELASYKTIKKAELDSRLGAVDESSYEEKDYEYMAKSVNSQKTNIDTNAHTFEEVDSYYQKGLYWIQGTVTAVQRQEQLDRIEAVYQSCLAKKESYDDSEWGKIEDAYKSKSSLNSFSELSSVKTNADSIIRRMNNAMTKDELADFETSRSDVLALLKAEYEKYEAKKADYDQSCKADEEGWAKLKKIYDTAATDIANVKKDEGKSAMTTLYEQAAADMAAVVSLKAKRESCESELKAVCGGYIASGLYNDKGKEKLNTIVASAISDMTTATSVKAINEVYEQGKTELANVTEASGETALNAAIAAAKAAFEKYFNTNYPDANESKYEAEDWTKLHSILTETLEKMDAVYTKSYAEDLAAVEKSAKEELGKITLKNEKLAALIAESMTQLGKAYTSNTALLDAAKDNLLEAFASFAYDLFEEKGEITLTAAIDAAKANLKELYDGAKALLESLGSSKEIEAKTAELSSEMSSVTQTALSIENTVAEADKWDGKTTSKPSAGDGTKDNPYIIDNAAELAWFANEVNGGGEKAALHARLGQDIDLAGYPWTAIGSGGLNADCFSGSFDGQGHTIHNLYIDTEGMSGTVYCGLFGMAGAGSEIKNLHIAGEIHFANKSDDKLSKSAFGGIAGYLKEGVIYNCVSSVKITRDKLTSASQLGGIAGMMSGGTIERCDSHAVFVDEELRDYQMAGGIVGSMSGSGTQNGSFAMVRYCTYNGSMKAAGSYLGGIAGYASSNAIIRECINNADIGNARGAAASAYAGGIVGIAVKNAKLMYVYNCGSINGANTTSGNDDGTGGIVGAVGLASGAADINENPYIAYAYNSGEASSTKNTRVGGLAGRITKGTVCESQSSSDNRMFGYVENSGTNVDNSILAESISFVSTGTGNSSELALAKLEATQSLLAKYRESGDSVYGTQTKAYNDIIDAFIRKIEEAKDRAAIAAILKEAESELAKAKTQLDADKEELLSELKLYVSSRVYDSKKAEGEEKSIAQQVTELLDTAVSEVEAAQSIAAVNNLREKYLGTEEAAGSFAYFETYNTQTIKGLYSDFIYSKAYTAEDLARVQAAYERWAADIEAASSEKRINELAAEAKKELTELTKDMQLRTEDENAGLPSFAGSEEDSLKAEKEAAYKALADKYNWKDYGDDEWGEISAIFAALQTSLNAADDSDAITAAVNAAKTQLDGVQTLEEQALALAAQDAKKNLAEKISELIEKLGKFFSSKSEETGEDKLNASPLKASLDKVKSDGETAIANAGEDADGNELTFENKTLEQIRETLNTAIEKAEAAFDSAKEKLQSLFEKVANADENAWNGTTLTKPQSGKGTQAEPYEITTAAELAWFAALVNAELDGEFADGNKAACAVLKNDINLAYNEWTAIGRIVKDESNTTLRAFTGSFDGGGHRIEGMSLTSVEGAASNGGADYYGLFGYVGNGGKISNLTVEGSINVTTGKDDRVGGIAAYVSGGAISNCISEVEINISIAGSKDDSKGCGGIAGEANAATIKGCENRGKLSAVCTTSNYAQGLGGIVGYTSDSNSSCKIERCINNGEIYAYKAIGTGGILGYAYSAAIEVNECVNTADICIEIITDTYGNGGTGGIVGVAALSESTGRISNVYNTGKIEAQSLAGGILGGESKNYQYQSSTGSGLATGVGSGSQNLTLSYAYNAGKLGGPNAEVSNRIASIAGLPVSGSYMTRIFMVEGTAKSSMGYISTKGNKITTISSEDLKKMAAKDVFSADSSAVESIADINSGYPIFAWQLLMSENRTQIKSYLNDYYADYVKPVASEVQCKQIESVLDEKLATIAGAEEAETVISAYKAALVAMDVTAVLEQARKEASGKLEGIDVTKYPQHLQKQISELLEVQRTEISKAENAKKMDEIVDTAYAGIVDILIEDIDNPKFAPASSTSDEAQAYKDKIVLAAAEYNNLSDTQKESVAGYIKIAQAEEKYQEYLDRSAAKEVDELIAAIGTVSTSSGAKIKAARDAYNALTANEKKYVGMLAVLEKAEATYAGLIKKEAGADDVIAKIDEIGKVTLESYDKIMSAMKAYNALTQGQASMVPESKVETLKAAMTKYNSLLEAAKTGNVIVTTIADMQGQSAVAEVKSDVIADAVDTAIQVGANSIIINVDSSGASADEILLSVNFGELRDIAESGKTVLKIKTIFGEIRVDTEELKRIIAETGTESKLIRINADGNNLGLSSDKQIEDEIRSDIVTETWTSNSGVSKYPMITQTLKYTGEPADMELMSKDISDSTNSSQIPKTDELVQISDTNPMAEPKKPFDWSILLMLVGTAAALGIGGGIFKWFTAAKSSRRK